MRTFEALEPVAMNLKITGMRLLLTSKPYPEAHTTICRFWGALTTCRRKSSSNHFIFYGRRLLTRRYSLPQKVIPRALLPLSELALAVIRVISRGLSKQGLRRSGLSQPSEFQKTWIRHEWLRQDSHASNLIGPVCKTPAPGLHWIIDLNFRCKTFDDSKFHASV